MNSLLFNQNFQQSLLKNIETIYEDFIFEMIEDLDSREAQSLFSENFLDDLAVILKDEGIKKYSPLKFYWTTLIDNFVYISQLHQDLASNINKKQNQVFQEIEEEIFDFWNDSDLVEIFKSFIDEGLPIEDSSLQSMLILEDHIISFYYLNISNKKSIHLEKLFYIPQENIGDSKQRIHLKNNKYFFDIPDSDYSLCSIDSINLDKKLAQINLDDESVDCRIKELNANVGFKSFKTIGDSKFNTRFIDALKVLDMVSPELSYSVENFSEYFVTINEPGIVSYSMQSLPKYSSINVYERDFLDLIDDITHENGHHFLNLILNQEELIVESPEQIYFSPWRKALRPIRGIYHGTFTFYFALKLFCDLKTAIKNPKVTEILNKYGPLGQSITKINKRIVEEFTLIEEAKRLINHTYKNKNVLPKGKEVIDWIFELHSSHSIVAKESEQELKLDDSNKKFFEELENVKEKGRHYILK